LNSTPGVKSIISMAVTSRPLGAPVYEVISWRDACKPVVDSNIGPW
jgi:hypothetical protein